MRLVLDTNVVVAGLLWTGFPHQLLDRAIDEAVSLCSSPMLVDELTRVLHYPKFAERISKFGTTPSALVAQYYALVTLLSPGEAPRVIEHDADDDHVLACAVAADAELIVSGDSHLHRLGGEYQGIPIVTAAEAVSRIAESSRS